MLVADVTHAGHMRGYAQVDDRLVWDMAQSRLPLLLVQVNALLVAP